MPRAPVALCVYYFVSFGALGLFLPFFPTWLVARGYTGAGMSAFVALRPIVGVIGPIGFGLLADILGLRGSLLRFACAGAALVMGLLTLAGAVDLTLGFSSLLGLMLAYFFFRAPMFMLADVTALESDRSYGRLRLWGSLGFMCSALVAGRFVEPTSSTAFPAAVTVALLLSLVAAWRLPVRTRAPARPVLRDVRELVWSRDFGWFLLAMSLWVGSHSGYDLTISLHLRDLGASPMLIGTCWAVGTLAEVAMLGWSGPLLRRYPAPVLLGGGLLGGVVRWLLLAHVRSLPALVALQPLHAASFALTWVSAVTFVKERAPAHVLASAQGLCSAALAVGGIVGVLTWGPVYATAGGAAVFQGAALVAGVGFACTLLLGRSRRRVASSAAP